MNIFEKVARRITRLSWNHTVHHIILEAMKRRIITSEQGHAILGAWNAECFPERGHASLLKAVEHSVQRTVDQPCEKHNMEFCSECFPVVVVDFNRR